ncbi:unnamed protein product [Gongylonema pulchrum]|uniref:LRRCT domain-containing protein n=1 Tax=Gongylonema pulchrum TaxID=637853 RepID=A0A183D5C7_9BILA|nr:unnamed protein product [Gongylonema pulchrum]
MNRCYHCPSVRCSITVIICIITAKAWPVFAVVTAQNAEHPHANLLSKDHEDHQLTRVQRDSSQIRISSSQCPSFCECEHAMPSDGGDGAPKIAVFCHEGGLEQATFSRLLKQVPRDVTILDVEAPPDAPNHLLWDDNLNQLRYLRTLRLVNCNIPAISRALKLRTLEALDLRGNRIEHISISVFAGVPSIRELNLAQNLLSVLPTGAFTYLKNLHILSLAHNNITEVSSNLLRDLRNLQALHLDGNRIPVTQLNLLFSDVPQLERLELNECGLSTGAINDLALGKFHSLERLGLAGNMLGKVPAAALRNGLHSLRTLDLADNGLVDIAPGVFARTNISSLLLAGNRLGASLDALRPSSLQTAGTLLELDLSRNNFAHFQSGILGEIQGTIEILHLSGNHITEIDQRLTANMTKLHSLHLGYNFIEYLPHKMPPREFAQLRFLNLSGNQLISLPDHSRELLPELQKLDISENRFISFPVTVIQNFLNTLEKVTIT